MLQNGHFACLLATASVTACASATRPPSPPLPAVVTFDRQDCDNAPDLASAVSLTPQKEVANFTVVSPVSGAGGCVFIDGSALPYAIFALPTDTADKTFVAGSAVEAVRILSPLVSTLNVNGTVIRTFALT